MPFFKRRKGKRQPKEKQFSAMENENAASRAGLLEPAMPGSKKFQDNILSALQNSYMYPESRSCFGYSSAHLINNAALQEQYQAFRTEKRRGGYTEEELEESFGFLLLDDEGKAKKLSEHGLAAGHSTCSTLGDPAKGVYISKYSDCLDLNPWYHGKSGYIAVLRLTKGRVKTVTENYTHNFTLPSPGFDCHVSEQITAVSSSTSSFLAYERTQYYLYETCSQGAGTVARPRHILPFAIVEFSYGETKPCASVLQEKSAEKTVFHYHPWKGQLQIQSLIYHIAMRSNTGALMPAQLPETLVIDRVLKLSDLRKLLPQSVFETCFTGEVSIEGRFCSLYEVVTAVANDASVHQLMEELKEKDLALLLPLKDSGLLVLLHSSYFLTYEDPMSERTEALLAMFVFPDSRAVQKATKRSSWSLLPEVMQILPGLNYAETEVEKCPPDQQGALCELMEHRLKSYATLIQPGMPDSPSREASGFPDQYDMPEVFKHLYSAPKCGEATLQRLQAYLEQPDSYTLPVARAVQLLAVGREENGDDSDDVVYCCLSSPEEAPSAPVCFHGEVNSEGSVSAKEAGVEGGAALQDSVEGGTSWPQEGEEGVAMPAAVSLSTDPEDHGSLGTAALTSVAVTETAPMAGDLPVDTITCRDGVMTSQLSDELVPGTGLEESAEGAVVTKAGDLLCEKGHHPVEDILLVQTTPGTKTPTGPYRRRVTRRSRRRRKRISNPAVPKGLEKEPRDGQRTCVIQPHPQPHPLKRKGFRYGLKTIVTDCGRVFIPHGSEILPKEIESLTEMQTANRRCLEEVISEPAGETSPLIETADKQALSLETTDGRGLPLEMANRQTPPMETADRQTPPMETADRQTPPMETADRQKAGLSCDVPVAIEVPPPVVTEKITDPENKKPPDKGSLEAIHGTKTLISLGELRTILQKGKRKKGRCPAGQVLMGLKEPPAGDNSEPHHKKSKSDSSSVNSLQNSHHSCGITVTPAGANFFQSDGSFKLTNVSGWEPNLPEKTQGVEGSPRDGARQRRNSPRRADLAKVSLHGDDVLPTLKSGSPPTTMAELVKLVKPFKKRLRSRITECMKENGWLNFGTSASQDCGKVGWAQPQGLKAQSRQSEAAGVASLGSEWGPTSQCQPADALTLLADLALGGSGDDAIEKLAPVLQTKLSVRGRRHAPRCKPPLRSSPSEGLVVSGELVLVISKEHSYSLPPSCLSGEPLRVSHTNSVETSSQSGQQGPLQHTDKDGSTPLCGQDRGREEVTNPPAGSTPPQHAARSRHKRGGSRLRQIIQMGNTIRVTRLWKEKYEFNCDSKYTNDPLDKTVTRALHGPWDFSIEDTMEQAHLILHMWIGLFYSRSTTRFFQTDPNGPVLQGRPPGERVQKESQIKVATQDGATPAALPSSEICRDSSEMQHYGSLPDSPPPEPEVLDLREDSKKMAEPLLPCPKVLDLSKKRSEALALSVISKHNIEDCSRTDSQAGSTNTLLHPIHKPIPRRCNWTMYAPLPCNNTYLHFSHKDHRARVDDISDEPSVQADDSSDSCGEDDDDGFMLTCPDATGPLENDSAYSQLCESTARVHITRGNLFNGTHKTTFNQKGNVTFHPPVVQLPDSERVPVFRKKERTSYIQPCRLTDINCKAAKASLPSHVNDSSSIKGVNLTPVCDEAKEYLTMCKEKDLSKDEEHTVVHAGNDIITDGAVHDGDASKVHTAVHDGIDFSNSEQPTAVHDGIDFSNSEQHTAVHDGIDFSNSEQHTAVHDGIDFSNSEQHTAVHDGIDFSNGEQHTAVHDGIDFSNGEQHTVHDGIDFSNGEQHTAVHDGTDFSNGEQHTAVHDGIDFSNIEQHTAVHDGIDFSNIEQHTVVHDNSDVSKSEERTAMHADSMQCIHPDEMHDRNSFSQDETLAVMLGVSDSEKSGPQTLAYEGSDSKRRVMDRSPTLTIDELPFDNNLCLNSSDGETCTSVSNANSLNSIPKSKESTSRNPTPKQDETPCGYQTAHYDGHVPALADPKSEAISVAELQQSDPYPNSTNPCTQRAPCVLDSPLSHSNTTLNQSLSQTSHELPSSCYSEPSLSCTTVLTEIPVCSDQESLPAEVSPSCSDDPCLSHICSPNHNSSTTTLKQDPVLQEPSCSIPPLKSNGHCIPTTNNQNPSPSDHDHLPNRCLEPKYNSTASTADPWCDELESILAPVEDSYGSQKPALNGVHLAEPDTQFHQPPTSPKHNTTDYSPSCSVSKNGSSWDLPHQHQDSSCDAVEDRRPYSEKKDRNALVGQDDDYEILPFQNHGLQISDVDLCKTVMTPKSKYNSRNDFSQTCSDGRDIPAGSVLFNNSEPFSKSKHSPTQSSPDGPCLDSTHTTMQGSLHRNEVPMVTSSLKGNLQHNYRDRKSRSGHAFAGDPPTHSSRKSHRGGKRPVMAVRPCQSEGWQGDISELLEEEKMTSPTAAEGSSGGAKYIPVELRKRHHQQEEECEEEEYSMPVDRESVSSGSLSGDIKDEGDSSPTSDDMGGSHSSWQWDEPEGCDVEGHTTAEICQGILYQSQDELDKQEMEEVLDYSKANPVSLSSDYSEGLGTSRASFLGPQTGSDAKEMDWITYCRSRKREGMSQSWVCKKEEVCDSHAKVPSIITVLDHRGSRKTYENYPIVKTVSGENTRTIHNTGKGSCHLLSFFKRWDELHHAKPDLTQSSLDLEYLIFSEKMNQLLKKNQRRFSFPSSTRYPWRHHPVSDKDSVRCGSPIKVHFSQLKESVLEDPCDGPMSFSRRKIKVDMPERVGLRASEPHASSYPTASETPLRLRLSYTKGIEQPCPTVSNITVECARTYHTMMDDVCSGKRLSQDAAGLRRERKHLPWHSPDFDSEKEDMCFALQDDLNTVVRQSSKVKFRFYILVTSANTFFEQTKEVLEAAGHVWVEPDQFDLGGRSCPTPLLIILRNEDIAEHAIEIPHLLELKKTPSVLFAGVDRPDDVLNLTHQELFSQGGFVVCDRVALENLSLDNIRMLVGFLEDLCKRGRWKWFLHYRDSRQLRENARSSSEARDLKHFVDCCQEAGLVEVLPYHECDVMSQNRPDYLHCLLHLQVQNAMARFPVFITDTPEDTFGKCGIFAMNINTFLRISRNDNCTIL